LFLLLENSIKAGTPVRNRDFSHALNIVKNGASTLKELISDGIQTSRKTGVTAKTLGQKQYLEAIRKYDVTLGSVRPAQAKHIWRSRWRWRHCEKESLADYSPRPAVEAGEGSRILPGDLYEKIDPYLRPLLDALYDMMPAEDIQKNRERGIIEIAPLAYMRGRTLNQAFIILDEAQNSTSEQMFMFLTRLGASSKAVVTGDETQVDLPAHRHSGLIEAHRVLRHVEGIAIVEFTKRDVVRHPLVQRIIAAYEEHRGKDRSHSDKDEA
jgi:phosphate starvation-inducible PhoH-like protein